MKQSKKATKTLYTILRQFVNQVPPKIFHEAVRENPVKSRSFDPWSHFVALVYQHITKTESLNGICDAARAHESEWSRIRNAEPPRRNTFSNANRRRSPKLAESLYWKLLKHFTSSYPEFAHPKRGGYLSRFHSRHIHIADSSTIQLVLNCIDWAKHRRKKAAAKMHLTLDYRSRLPEMVVVEEASHSDVSRLKRLCEGFTKGDILLIDRGYVDFSILAMLSRLGVFFVTRSKSNMKMVVVEERQTPCAANKNKNSDKMQILRDEIIRPEISKTAEKFTSEDGKLRRVAAWVEVDGHMREMEFITNNCDWSAKTIAELYKARWEIEVFFKELKQTCQIRDFIGYNENAVKWQIWVGLIVHLILRFIKFASQWGLSFSRLAGLLRAVVWVKRDLFKALALYGTASGQKSTTAPPKPLYVQALFNFAVKLNGTASCNIRG